MTTALGLPGHVSYSQVNTYLKCGEQFRLERLLHAPQAPAWALAGGSAVHTATEEWDRAYLTGEIIGDFHTPPPTADHDFAPRTVIEGAFTDLWAKHFAEQIADTEQRSDVPKEQWRASGRKSAKWPEKETEAWWNFSGPSMLASWAAWRLNSPWEIWTAPDGTPAIEISGTISLDGVLVKGAIDRIMVDPDGAILPVDIKSGGEPDSTLQLGTYAKMMRDHFGVNPKWGTYWMARTGSTTALHEMGKYTDEYLELVYGGARKGMEAGLFLPKVGRDCSWCSVRASCFAYGGENAAEFTPLSNAG